MADYLDKIEEGLVIAQPEIVLPWNLKKSNVFDELDGVNIVNEKLLYAWDNIGRFAFY